MTRIAVVLLILVAVLGVPAAALARPQSTLDQTIADRDGDNRLEPGPGEGYVVRTELGAANPDRARTREERLFFGQLTDIHVIDEESPLRVEFLDQLGDPFTSAYRPQEALSTQVLDESVRQMRNTTSPVSHHGVQLVMATGDSADNTQLNETRWMIDLLDGGKVVDPDSGVPGTCGAPDRVYQGVRGGGRYYEPDASAAPPADPVDGPGYSPSQAQNEAEAHRSSAVRDYPSLLERANEPFRATGLGVPWYQVFGNHDALIQGNQPHDEALAAYATGCLKVTDAPATTLPDAIAALRDPAGSQHVVVQSDPRRRPLSKREWIAQHDDTTGAPAGHGFDLNPAAVAQGMGYYDFSPRPGLRFVVLDTINEGGLDDGNVDDEQFRWLHRTLLAADTAGEIAVVFAHHTLETLDQPALSPFPADPEQPPTPLVHLGFGAEGATGDATGCPTRDRAAEPDLSESLHCLLLRHRSVVAFVNGHVHHNSVEAFPRERAAGPADGGFWQINTASHIDWPQQARTIDIFDNRDGTLSLFGTILDHAAAPNPGNGPATPATSRLASISRELAFNDPQAQNGEDGTTDARGAPGDRNVELLVRDPRRGP